MSKLPFKRGRRKSELAQLRQAVRAEQRKLLRQVEKEARQGVRDRRCGKTVEEPMTLAQLRSTRPEPSTPASRSKKAPVTNSEAHNSNAPGSARAVPTLSPKSNAHKPQSEDGLESKSSRP